MRFSHFISFLSSPTDQTQPCPGLHRLILTFWIRFCPWFFNPVTPLGSTGVLFFHHCHQFPSSSLRRCRGLSVSSGLFSYICLHTCYLTDNKQSTATSRLDFRSYLYTGLSRSFPVLGHRSNYISIKYAHRQGSFHTLPGIGSWSFYSLPGIFDSFSLGSVSYWFWFFIWFSIDKEQPLLD